MCCYRFASRLVLVVSLAFVAATALAWEPLTHAFLARFALDEILATPGHRVPIYATDYLTGRVLTDSMGRKILIGRYEVNEQALNAILNNPGAYFAGVAGPDAFPDILTGQEIIHPAGHKTPGQGRRSDGKYFDVNQDDPAGSPQGPGSNKWLQHLYNCAFKLAPNGRNDFNTDANRAFAMGFIDHAAGDMYAHTFINNFTGGPFNVHSGNAEKHVLLELYIQTKTPPISDANVFKISLDHGVSDFMYECMIRGDKTGFIKNLHLLDGSNISLKMSLPATFSRVRDKLQAELDAYDHMNSVQRAAYDVAHPFAIPYMRNWVVDIDDGLKALPSTSLKLAQSLLFKPRDIDPVTGIQTTDADDILNDYTNQHLLSMSGLPDAAGQIRAGLQGLSQALESFRDAILTLVGLQELIDWFHDIEFKTANAIIKAATGLTIQDYQEFLTSPGTYFDSVLNNPSMNQDGGELITRAAMDQQLHLGTNGTFDIFRFPAAYNSMTMIKLSLLSQNGLKQLLADLNGGDPVSTPLGDDAVLDFLETLDGSNQWKANANKMVLARNSAFYQHVFMRQPGEEAYPSIDAFSTSSSQGDGAPTYTGTVRLAGGPAPASGCQVSLQVAALSGDTDAELDTPVFVSVAPGQTQGSFTDVLPSVSKTTRFRLTAISGNAVSTLLTVNPPSLGSLFLAGESQPTPNSKTRRTMAYSTHLTLGVTLDAPAPKGGAIIEISADKPGLGRLPASVTVPEGATTTTFSVVPPAAPVSMLVITVSGHYAGFQDNRRSVSLIFQGSNNFQVEGPVLPKINVLRVRPPTPIQKVIHAKIFP